VPAGAFVELAARLDLICVISSCPFDLPISGWTINAPGGPTELIVEVAGRAALRGNGDFTFTRHGDKIDFEGLVDHRFDEPYDFENDFRWDNMSFAAPDPNGPGPLLFWPSEGVLLQDANRAQPFRMVSGWQQRVAGRLRVDPSGKLILDQEPVWTDISPNEIRR
jgi:hypothetical protein